MATPKTDRRIGTPEVAKRIGVSRYTAARYARDGVLPPPLHLNPGAQHPRHYWRESEIDRWLAEREEARRHG